MEPSKSATILLLPLTQDWLQDTRCLWPSCRSRSRWGPRLDLFGRLVLNCSGRTVSEADTLGGRSHIFRVSCRGRLFQFMRPRDLAR